MTKKIPSRLLTDSTDKSRAPYQFVLDRVKTYHPNADLNLIRRACEFAIATHRGETRLSGRPFVIHPLRVAYLLAQMNMDAATIAAGSLHDTIENTSATAEQLNSLFGQEVASLVLGVTNVNLAEDLTKDEKRAGGFRKMIEAMLADIRVLFIKFCDRLHNMRTLGSMPDDARRRIARETAALYVPLAARFGIFWLWREFEELSFRYLEPEKYQSVKTHLGRVIEKLQPYEAEVVRSLKSTLADRNLKTVIKIRSETVYRVSLRMLTENKSIDQLEGIVYFRILVADIPECYATLEAIHSQWQVAHGSFKDYIKAPKSNRYQSLHLTVFDKVGKTVQLLIRTRDMDRIDERGITAHWSPDQTDNISSYYVDVTDLINRLAETKKEDQDPLHFARAVARTLYADEVRVFTPKGDLIEMPKGSTILDFAYAIHSELGHSCAGGMVDGHMVDIDYVLLAGQVVKVITSPETIPQERWLDIALTLKARRHIKQFLKFRRS